MARETGSLEAVVNTGLSSHIGRRFSTEKSEHLPSVRVRELITDDDEMENPSAFRPRTALEML